MAWLMVMEGHYSSRPCCDVNCLYMRDVYNGQILGTRGLGTKYSADFFLPACVATAEAVYLANISEPAVLVLHPETGDEMRRIDLDGLGGDVVRSVATEPSP